MAIKSGTFQMWDRAPRRPVPPPPAGSVDCQFHIYGDAAKYPLAPTATYPVIDATFQDAVRMHEAMGFRRGVIVHSSLYGNDHRLLLDTLENLPPALRGRYKATSLIDDSTTDKEIERLDVAGVCAVRLNIAKMFGVTPSQSEALRTIDRIRGLGWHCRLHVRGNDLLEFSDALKSVRGVNMVIDHMGHVDYAKGLGDPTVRWILDMLQRDNWWMMVSNGNRDSAMNAGWDDAVPFGRAYIEAAPERIIWGTDWPHPMWTKRMMNDAEEVELLYRYVDNDSGLLQKILVDNPVRLHGFR